MNVANPGPLIISMFLWAVYIIVPTVNVILGLVTILRMKKIISEMGELFVKIDSDRSSHIVITSVYSAIFLICSVFLFIAVSRILGVIIFTFFFRSWFLAFKGDLLSKSGGVYKSGIILEDKYFMWDMIHSYTLMPDGRVSLLTNKGKRFDLPDFQDFNMEEFLPGTGIVEEKVR